jgi:hypothetical protein
MKRTTENIRILKKLGFTCDYDRTKNPLDEDWFSLKDGWGFRLDAIRSFRHLVIRLMKADSEKE